jgi:hypothetical protein
MMTPKKRAAFTGDLVGVRVQPGMAKQLDDWRRLQDDLPGRPEAIRRLVGKALSAEPPSARARSKGGPEAAEMAGREIDQLGDQSATSEERASRKRRLIRGPKEFRDMRKK